MALPASIAKVGVDGGREREPRDGRILTLPRMKRGGYVLVVVLKSGSLGLPSGRSARALDHFPELGIVLKLFVLARGQVGSEEEVADGVPAEDPVHDDAQNMTLEVEAVVAKSVTRQGAAIPGEATEMGVLALQFLRQAAELTQDMQLKIPRELRELRGTGRIEDDLERLHPRSLSGLGAGQARAGSNRGSALNPRLNQTCGPRGNLTCDVEDFPVRQ
jgi:hypothetical protein